MADENPRADHELIEQLAARVDVNEGRIRALQDGADSAEERADVSEARAGVDRGRIDRLEERADVDAALIAELRAEGLVAREHAENLEEALTTSRRIGAAIGVVMARTGATEAEAFDLLKRASPDTNRKVRLLADDVVLTGDVTMLRTR